jgi:hypothetical protein
MHTISALRLDLGSLTVFLVGTGAVSLLALIGF